MGVGIQVEHLNAWFGKTQALYDISMNVAANHATAIIGPSGCGKSTFVRCLNRMHETIPEAHATGRVRIGDLDVYNGTSAVQIRRRIGMVFQKPNPFPTMSIYDNVAAGLKLNGFHNRRQLEEVVERSLRSAALWEEVKDIARKKSGASLSGGQQQRLCIARALAVEPEVLLMAEQAVERAARAFQTQDLAVCQLVLRDEPKINSTEREVDELAIDLLAMQQPMAIDLRLIIACIKINADLERVGDQAVNIAERVIDLANQNKTGLSVDIPRMAGLAITMVHDALQSFVNGDVEQARSVLERDDLVDNLNREIFEAADYAMIHSVENHRYALDTLLVARNLERVADHATNIAEDVIFWIQGSDVRHHAQT